MSQFDWGDQSSWKDNQSGPRMSDMVEMADVTNGEWNTYRMIGGSIVHKTHWIQIKVPKGLTRIPKPCVGFDPKNPKARGACPYCDKLGNNPSTTAYVNVIDRALQEAAPKKAKPPSKSESKLRTNDSIGKFHYKKEKGAGGWTPVRVLSVGSSVGTDISSLVGLNKRKNKKTGETATYTPENPRFGFDISIKYDAKAAAAKRFTVQKSDNSALEEEELDYLLWEIPEHSSEDIRVAEKECAQLMKKVADKDGNLLYPEAASEGGKRKKKNEYQDDFDEDEDLEDDDDEDAPRKKKSSKSKSKSRYEDEDDDDDEDDDEEEDENPRKKKSSKSKSKSKSRYEDEEDDEEDEDEEDDEEEDERPRNRSKSSKSKAKTKVSSKKKSHYEADEDIPF